jgi:hypothetical protein
MKTLDPKIKHGKWSAEEDRRLNYATHAYSYGKNWIMVRFHVPGRTDVQCRER